MTKQTDLDLTARQIEILHLIAEDLTDEQIAARLTLSTATVNTHVKRIRARMGVTSRSGAVAKALRSGLIE